MKPDRSVGRIFSILILILTASLVINLQTVEGVSSLDSSQGLYGYKFVLDGNGSAAVTINYTSSLGFGSSWVLVPKFLGFNNRTINGRITELSFTSTKETIGVDYYFYRVLHFSFESDDLFTLIIRYNFTNAAMIIEPKGIFYSPQIGFKEEDEGKVEVVFPSNFVVNPDKAIASGNYNYQPSSTSANYVLFDALYDNLLRVQIEFTVENSVDTWKNIKSGLFTFKTVSRYEEYASEILDLFNRTYEELVDLFNVTLPDIHVEFFIPNFESLFSLGGYVPFNGKEIGNIHINVFFTRYTEGYIEVTALHELIHHFLWEVGLSPEKLLWFHEGVAQYVSIEVAGTLGYEGASMIRQELEDSVSFVREKIGDNLGFLLRWTPSYSPTDIGILYTAAYYVVSRLAEPYGLEYYARFFKLINGIDVEDNDILAYYLSLTANASVVPKLKSWGFDIPDLYTYSTLILEAKRAVQGINPIFQPYKFLAEQLYKWALINMDEGQTNNAKRLLMVTIIVANLAPLLTEITASAILLAVILYALKRKGLFSEQSSKTWNSQTYQG